MASVRDNLLQELRFQLTVTRAILGTLELDQLFHIILSGITHGEGLDFNRACLFRSEPERRTLRAAYAVGPTSRAEALRIWNEIAQKELDLESLLASYEAAGQDPTAQRLGRQLSHLAIKLPGRPPVLEDHPGTVPVEIVVAFCATTRRPFVANTLTAVATSGETGEPLHFAHLVGVPLLREETVLGVILADNTFNGRAVSVEDLRALTTLGNLAAISIDKAQLHLQLKAMAEQDGLTGLNNRRQYEVRLDRAIGRAVRMGQRLALIVLDIDHFKQCNDRHGHEVGDQVLKDLGELLKSSFRRHDVVARFGGEEFVVLLTGGLSRGEAFLVAENIRRKVERISLGGLPVGDVTITAGVASVPPDRLVGNHLFRLADEALYAGKREGRNRVVLSESV